MSNPTHNPHLSLSPLKLGPPELTRTFELAGYSYGERATLLPALTSAFTQVGGWVLDRKTTSSNAVEFTIELQLRSVVELYSAIVAAGIELTRATHATLTGLCTCRRHTGYAVGLKEVLTLRLEVSFLEDITLHSLLMTGSGLA